MYLSSALECEIEMLSGVKDGPKCKRESWKKMNEEREKASAESKSETK